MAAEHGPTAGEYIIHHLTHLQNHKASNVFDLSVFNFDSMFWAIGMGIVGCWLLWLAARKATSGVPGRFQAAVEILVEMVDSQAKGIVHNAQSRKFVAPLHAALLVAARQVPPCGHSFSENALAHFCAPVSLLFSVLSPENLSSPKTLTTRH